MTRRFAGWLRYEAINVRRTAKLTFGSAFRSSFLGSASSARNNLSDAALSSVVATNATALAFAPRASTLQSVLVECYILTTAFYCGCAPLSGDAYTDPVSECVPCAVEVKPPNIKE